MAKRKRKPRTPPPPRRPQSDAGQAPRVQAPQVRKKEKRERSSDQQERRARITLYALGGSGLVGLVAVIAFFVFRGGGGGGTNEAALGAKFSAAGCSYRTNPGVVVRNSHTNNIKDKIKYASYPPTNGKHYVSPARWDFYTQPVPPVEVVHNEEHGGVIVWYGQKVSQATVAALQEFYNEDPVSMLVTPLAKFDSKVAISAWTQTVPPTEYGSKPKAHYYGQGHLAVCSKVDDQVLKALRSFRDDFVGKGPEGISKDQNQPRSG